MRRDQFDAAQPAANRDGGCGLGPACHGDFRVQIRRPAVAQMHPRLVLHVPAHVGMCCLQVQFDPRVPFRARISGIEIHNVDVVVAAAIATVQRVPNRVANKAPTDPAIGQSERLDGVGPLLVLKTASGSAGAVTEALDQAGWGEVMGTIAGDDTVLVITRSPKLREAIASRIQSLVRK